MARPLRRSISMWRTMVGVCSLLVQPVAKTWCQNSAIFSSSGRLDVDHPPDPTPVPGLAGCRCWRPGAGSSEPGRPRPCLHALGVDKLLDDFFIRARRVRLKLLARCPESSAPQQVGHQGETFIGHAFPPNRASDLLRSSVLLNVARRAGCRSPARRPSAVVLVVKTVPNRFSCRHASGERFWRGGRRMSNLVLDGLSSTTVTPRSGLTRGSQMLLQSGRPYRDGCVDERAPRGHHHGARPGEGARESTEVSAGDRPEISRIGVRHHESRGPPSKVTAAAFRSTAWQRSPD